MIHVIAVITAKPGKREEILKHARLEDHKAGGGAAPSSPPPATYRGLAGLDKLIKKGDPKK